MALRDAVAMALHSLRISHLRGALATAGVVVGVAAIILVAGIGKGMQTSFDQTLGPFATLVEIEPAKVSQPGVDVPPRALTDADVAALADPSQTPGVLTVTPVVSAVDVVRFGALYSATKIEGSTVDFPRVANQRLAAGSLFTAAQSRDNARVVLLGPGPVANLFAGDAQAAIGQSVHIARTSFRVIGVLRPNAAPDALAVMPLGAARRYVLGNNDEFASVLVACSDTAAVAPAVDHIITLLSARHHITDPAKRDFTVTADEDLLSQDNQTSLFLQAFVMAAAAISLLVGAVGIANVILVSVSERTKEIGVRRAVGAKRRAIIAQFLLESSVLAGLGGLSGVIVGIGVTLLAGQLVPRFIPGYGTPELSFSSVAVGLALSLLVGITAGVHPARRASRMLPIEALRFE
jgi:putative ABC transport system permease protein